MVDAEPTRIVIESETRRKSVSCVMRCRAKNTSRNISNSATYDELTSPFRNAKSITDSSAMMPSKSTFDRECSSSLTRDRCDSGMRDSERLTAPPIADCSQVCNENDAIAAMNAPKYSTE